MKIILKNELNFLAKKPNFFVIFVLHFAELKP